MRVVQEVSGSGMGGMVGILPGNLLCQKVPGMPTVSPNLASKLTLVYNINVYFLYANINTL